MNKSILKLAVPNIISNITIPLLGLEDMALMGHMGDERYIGAIALGGVISNRYGTEVYLGRFIVLDIRQ